MHDGVKLIFRVLLGTIVIMFVSSVVVETANLYLTTIRIRQLTTVACNKAVEYFAQETYRDRGSDSTGTVEDMSVTLNLPAVPGLSDSENVIYEGSVKDVYNSLYGGDSYFIKEFITSTEVNGKFKTLNEYATDGSILKENLVTPLNLGITYLDKATCDKIFKWNVCALFSNFKEERVYDSGGSSDKAYILAGGFRIYYKTAEIEEIKYKVYNLENPGDSILFREQTGIEADRLRTTAEDAVWGEDDRNKVCVADVTYSVEVGFEGITPLRGIFNYFWGGGSRNNRVVGWDGKGELSYNGSETDWNVDARGKLTNEDSESLPTTGSVIYYVVR